MSELPRSQVPPPAGWAGWSSPPDDDEAAAPDLGAILEVLRRRWRAALLVFATVGVPLLVVAALLPGKHKVRGLVLLGQSAEHDPSRGGRDAVFNKRVFETHRGLLTSDGVVDDALRQLGREPATDRSREQLRKELLEATKIQPLEGTFLVSVEAQGPDGGELARQTNALMDAWLPFTDRFLGSEGTRGRSLEEQEQRLRERQAELIRRHPEIAARGLQSLTLRRDALAEQRRLALERQTAIVVESGQIEAERMQVERRLKQVTGERGVDGLVGLLGQDAGRTARGRSLDEIRARLEHLRQTSQPERLETMPEYAALQAQLLVEDRALRELLRQEAAGELTRARARTSELSRLGEAVSAHLRQLTGRLRAADQALAVAQPVATELTWFDEELARVRGELRRVRSEAADATALIVDRAETPVVTASAFSTPALALMVVVALGLSVGGAFLAEHQDARLRTAAQLSGLRRPVLGLVPRLDLRTLDEKAHLRESRSLPATRAALVGRLPEEARTVLVCAPGAGDGCTLAALLLAQGLAGRGPTLLVDAGRARRATAALAPGALTGASTPCEWVAGLEVQPVDEPERTLGSIDPRHRHVVVDGGAVHAGTAVLARRVDAVVLAVRVGHTLVPDVHAAIEALGDGARELSLVVVDVSARDDLDGALLTVAGSGARAATVATASATAAPAWPPAVWPPQAPTAGWPPAQAQAQHQGWHAQLPLPQPQDLLAGVDPSRVELLERTVARLQASGSAPGTPISEEQMRAAILETLREMGGPAAAAAAAAASAGGDDRYDMLEKRLGKVSDAVSDLEKLMAAVAQAAAEGGGIASMFKDFQGIDPNDPRNKKKNSVLSKIFEDNLEIQGTAGGKSAAAPAAAKG